MGGSFLLRRARTQIQLLGHGNQRKRLFHDEPHHVLIHEFIKVNLFLSLAALGQYVYASTVKFARNMIKCEIKVLLW